MERVWRRQSQLSVLSLEAAELRWDSLILATNSHEFLVLIWSISERQKVELTLEPPSSFELAIQLPNHRTTAQLLYYAFQNTTK